jgi:HK97 family phage portal protein
MKLLDKINTEHRARLAVTERRTIGGVPWRPWASPYFGGRNAFAVGGPRSPTEALGEQEGMLGLSAVWGCCRHIADSVASLPIKTYRRSGDGSATRISTALLGDEVAGGGPQITGSLYTWIFEATAACLLHGSCFGLITNRSGLTGPDGLGLPTQVAWLEPQHVSVQNDPMMPCDPRRAKVFYMGRRIDQSELVHLKAFAVPGKLEGISPLRAHASLWALGHGAREFAADFFANGGHPPGIMRNVSEEVTESQANEIRRILTDTIRLHQPLVIGSDWEFSPLSIPSDERMFVLSRQMTATEVAAIYGVPPWRVGGIKGGSLTYASQVQDASDELQNCFRPWLRRWESLLTGMLPASQYAVFDGDAYLKTDPETRSKIHATQRETGERNVNELRAEDDLGPVQGGDDSIPLAALTGMLRSTRAIPKSLLPLLDLEADRVAGLIESMQQQDPGLVASTGKPPVAMNAEQYLGQMITSGRQAEVALAELRRRRDDFEASGDA